MLLLFFSSGAANPLLRIPVAILALQQLQLPQMLLQPAEVVVVGVQTHPIALSWWLKHPHHLHQEVARGLKVLPTAIGAQMLAQEAGGATLRQMGAGGNPPLPPLLPPPLTTTQVADGVQSQANQHPLLAMVRSIVAQPTLWLPQRL
jgi:hypothetical protein